MFSVVISAVNVAIFNKVAVAIVAALIGLAVYYNDRAILHERRKNVLYCSGYPLVGSLPILIKHKNKMLDLLLEIYHKYKTLTMAVSTIGFPHIIFTLDPRNVEYVLKGNFDGFVKGPDFHKAANDLFGNGIFNIEGDEWKKQRKTGAQVINVKNVRDQFTGVFLEKIQYMMENIWDKAVETQSIVDFQDIMFKFTLDCFILLGSSIQLNTLDAKDPVPFAVSFNEAQHLTFKRFTNPMYPIVEFLDSLVHPWKSSMTSHMKVLNEFFYKAIEQRREQQLLNNGQEVHKDLLSRFMNSKNANGEPWNNTDLRDIMLNFALAARDTTAVSLSWTFYMLMTHPQVEDKLLDEINANINMDHVNDAGRMYETIKNMKFAHAVFYEVLRLYPAVPIQIKEATQDDVFPDGTIIKKGDNILWCPYVQGRVEDIWGADAKQFKPERWFNENGDFKYESQGKWPAFNGGPRTCLGQQFAIVEALLTIIFMVRKYKFTLIPGQDITHQSSVTLPMKNGMEVMVENR